MSFTSSLASASGSSCRKALRYVVKLEYTFLPSSSLLSIATSTVSKPSAALFFFLCPGLATGLGLSECGAEELEGWAAGGGGVDVGGGGAAAAVAVAVAIAVAGSPPASLPSSSWSYECVQNVTLLLNNSKEEWHPCYLL